MHFPGLVPLIIVLVLAFLLFGRPGRLSNLMEDLGKGIRGFRKGLSEDQQQVKSDEPPARQVTADQPAANRETANSDTNRTGA